MSKFTKELINDYAEKLLIGLTDEETDIILEEFDVIEQNMELIANIPNISEVSPMTHTLDNFEFILRDDVKEEGIEVDKLLQNCDKTCGREVEVPKVVG
ncbi:MAG: aspartyl/glutamyl-tRNA amidotransferase subunit C [Firmicutes bacterium]|nr:aspartyl/glutamyl-tRNA amidotransferase subunit C [Bacillota bacterium]